MKALTSEELALLRKVPFLACVDDGTLSELAQRGRRASYRKNDRIVSELEPGAEVFVVLAGQAEASLETARGERERLGQFGPGSAFGEMSSLTGELRSATVLATGNVEVLVIADDQFDDLRQRRPLVAVTLVRTMAARMADAERTIQDLLTHPEEHEGVPVRTSVVIGGVRRGSISRAWRELVVGHKKDLTFLVFVAFVLTLLVVRATVYLSFRADFAPMDVLRAAYTTGFGLLGVSSCASLLTFRPGWRRAIAVAYGVALALILNELGVTLAFDIFYKNITTPDPNVPFDVEELYRRTEGVRAVMIAFAVLLQAAYLRPFWRRAAFVLRTRLRKAISR
jgi:CRP-like cAMP-binding protein